MVSLPVFLDTLYQRLHDNRTLATRFVVVGSVLLISGLLLPKFSARNLTFLLLLSFGAVIAQLFSRWSHLGIAVFLFGSILIPFQLGAQLNVAVVMILLLSGLWLLEMIVHKRLIYLSSPLLPLLGLAIVAALSLGFGQLPWFAYGSRAPIATQIGGLVIFLASVAAFFLGSHQVKDIRWLQVLVWIYLASGAYRILARLVPFLGPVLSSFLPEGSAGGMLAAWLAPLSASQALFNRKLSTFWRVLLGLLVISVLYSHIVKTKYASGWIPMVVGLVIVLCLRFPRQSLFGLVLGGMALLVNFQKVFNILLVGNEFSLASRLEAWNILLEIIKFNPILGLGPANYRTITSYFPIMGFYVPFNSHNNYIDIVAQTGILGLIFFLWFVWEITRLGWRLRNHVPKGGFPHAFVIGALGGLGGMLVAAMLGDWMIPFVYNVGFRGLRASLPGWLFLGVLLFFERMYGRQAFSGSGLEEVEREQ